MKIIVNIEGHVQVPLDQPPLQQTKDNRRDDAELAVLPEQRLQAEIDKLTISEWHRRPWIAFSHHMMLNWTRI